MKTITKTMWLMLVAALFGAASVSAQQLSTGAGNSAVADGIGVRFPGSWRLLKDTDQIIAESPDSTTSFTLLATGKDNFDNVRAQVLTPWMDKLFDAVKVTGEDNSEANKLGLRKISFSGKRKADSADVNITAQFAFRLGDEPPKTVLLISVANVAGKAKYSRLIDEVFTKQARAEELAAGLSADIKEAAEPEWKPRQIEKWSSLKDANFTMGFTKDWTVSEMPGVITANSPDKKVLIIAEVVEAKTAKEAVEHLQEELDRYLAGVKLTDPEVQREENSLKVLASGGTAQQKGASAVNVGVDIVEVDGKIVVVAIYGAAADLEKYFTDIILAQESYKKAR